MATTAQGRALTAAHRQAQLVLSADLLREIAKIWPTFDPANIDDSWALLAPAVESLIDRYRGRSAGTSSNYLRRFAESEVQRAITVASAEPLAAETITANLLLAGPITAKKLTSAGGGNVSARTLERVAASAMRLAANGGREVIHNTVKTEPRIVGYYRVTDGNPCAFCAMLAGLGVHYDSKSSALYKGGGDKYHDRCGCTAEPAFEGATFTPPPQTERFQTLWREATQGKSGKEARLAFRRAFEGR